MSTIVSTIFRSRTLCFLMAVYALYVGGFEIMALGRLRWPTSLVIVFWTVAACVQAVERHRQSKAAWASFRAEALAKRVEALQAEPPRRVPVNAAETTCCRCAAGAIGEVQTLAGERLPVCLVHASEIANENARAVHQSNSSNNRPVKGGQPHAAGHGPNDGPTGGRNGGGKAGGGNGNQDDSRRAGPSPGGADVERRGTAGLAGPA